METVEVNVQRDIDLTGEWLIRSRLGAGLTLGLRLAFARDVDNERVYEVKFWLHDQARDAPALVTTQTEVDENGHFQMVADPLDLGKDVVQSESAVMAIVILDAQMIDGNSWCGGVTGQVTSPLNLDLDGSTFYSQRLTDGLTLDDIPSSCPLSECNDGGLTETRTDMGLDTPTPVKPESPDLSDQLSRRVSLTGDWVLKAQLGGLPPLNLWLSFYDHNPEATSIADGSVRLTGDDETTPPRLQFFTEIDNSGRFEIWFPNLELEVPPLNIRGSLLLSAISSEDYFCGVGGGIVREPFEIDLSETTFYAARWVPKDDIDESMPDRCPPSETLSDQ